MSVRLGLLGLVQVSPSHGYMLKQRYDELLDPDQPVQPAQVYSTLARLERDGLITTSTADGPVRRTYSTTELGDATLDHWLRSPVEPEPRLHSVLYTKVVLALLTGRPVENIIDTQRQAHLVRMRELTGLRQSSDPAVTLLADYALFHLESDLRWLDLTATRVDEISHRIASRPLRRGELT